VPKSLLKGERMITKVLRVSVLGLAFLLGSGGGAGSAEKTLLAAPSLRSISAEVSGEIAFRYTVRISQFDRIQANAGWHEAAVWIKDKLEKFGYSDAVIEGWPSNGAIRYYTYKTPIGWRAEQGELWMIAPRRERLCSYEEIPLTLVKHSGSGHVEAELVDVGSGTGDDSYKGKDVKGKIVLSTGGSGQVMREACQKRGALGVITYFPPDVRPGYPNMIRYTAFWPNWEERDKLGFGFNVSKNQGAELKRMLEEGEKIILKADVEAEFFETRIEALSVSFQGTEEPGREVLVVGHLCHPLPSANDNGSGSAGMLEVARALKKLVDSGELPAPRRTIRFLWIPEFYGTVPYIKAHLGRTRNTLAAINCDMIGEDLHKTGGRFNIVTTPDSMPSFLNDVVVHFTRAVEGMNLKSMNGSDHPFAWVVAPFSGGSDHFIFNDGALKVPSVMFNHGDTFHHTSLDTPDKVDPAELRRVCTITLASLYYLANAGESEAEDMARLVSRNGAGRLAAEAADALDILRQEDRPAMLTASYGQVLNVISHTLSREKMAVGSAAVFSSDRDFKKQTIAWTAPLDALAASYRDLVAREFKKACAGLGTKVQEPKLTEAEAALDRIVPVRDPDFVCPLQADYLIEKLDPEAAEGIRLRGYAGYEAINFADGRRSLLEITRAVEAEYGPQNIRDVHEFFKTLEAAGLFSLSKKS
jgi:aminopeptidase YwaD